MMMMLSEGLPLACCVLACVAFIQMLSSRTGVPEATLLCIVGISVGASYVVMDAVAPSSGGRFFAPLIDPNVPADAYLWFFLPPLLFQVALSVDVRGLLRDITPILLLAVVAVVVATGAIGLAVAAVAPQGLVVCLLLGAIVATTDPSAVVGIFRDIGAPGRLIGLVEGESLLNDAAAIALAGVLTAALTSAAGAPVDWLGGLGTFAHSFLGGAIVGLLAGRVLAAALFLMNNIAPAETALTMALPHALYLFADRILDVSGVVAVVCAALVVNALGRTRISPRSWSHVTIVWEQIAAVAGASVFLLSAARVPRLLGAINYMFFVYLLVAVVAALLARLAVLFVLLPALGRFRLGEPISRSYRLAIAWGGLRGAVTLVLALGVSENPALGAEERQFISMMATGFVLWSLLVNGSSLRWLVRRLGLDRLSPQDQALQRQATMLSSAEVADAVKHFAAGFGLASGNVDDVTAEYRHAISDVDLQPGAEPSEDQRIAAGFVTLATRERDLIPEYGDGVISVSNLDAMMRNTGHMIDAARIEGRVGYSREARRILEPQRSLRVASWLARHLHVRRPLAAALADRFELLICRRAVLERLKHYSQRRLLPLLGEPVAQVLGSTLAARSKSVEEAIQSLRLEFPEFASKLERRLLILFAFRQGRASMETMVAERMISKELYGWVCLHLDHAWDAGLQRPRL
ncbi:sodium:proton antiporter [Variovorax sp. dw_308]|uniref:cation:proton antiporter n=1 Tax=Variovorax sp. dw_308 TaxID=2721546 RepID=UPI00210B7D2B|nr:cation:proton antiporter [Variovorax sp. dw_308]